MSKNELDATVVAPDSHKIIFENDRVRVLQVSIEPGIKEPVHVHQFPSVMTVTDSVRIRYFNEDGTFFDIQPQRNVKTEWIDPEPLHAVENIDSKPYKAIRVELKQ